MPVDEGELEIIRSQRARAEIAMRDKVLNIWVGFDVERIEGFGFKERTKDLVDRPVNGEWVKFLEGGKDGPLGGFELN